MNNEIDIFTNLHFQLLKDINYNYQESSTIIIDLVTIMGTIYYMDVSVPKNEYKARMIDVLIPVFNRKLWEENSNIIEELFTWVSEDNFKINFTEIKINAEGYINNLIPSNYNNVTLFSGGLDSFAGAYNNYINAIQSDYVGFVNKGEEKTKQVKVSKFYRKVFSNSTEIILIDKLVKKKKNFIQSTRSLLYLALAIAKAHFNFSNNVYLYENGILSLNPEINNRYTTKTTHPKTIFLYSSLLQNVNINIKIHHPFIFKTKGQITNDMDENFKNTIKHTFTCGQGRSQPERDHKGQCGICIPCILRKISLAAYNNENYDVHYKYPYDIKVKDIKEDLYRKDYVSNLNYFQSYYDLIVSGNIHLEIITREKYYKGNSNFRKCNSEMFLTFAHEYERFMEKYALY